MLTVINFIVLLIIFITMLIIFKYVNNDALACISVFLIIIVVISLIMSAGTAIQIKLNTDIEYQNKLVQKEMLEYQLYNEDNISRKARLYLYSEIAKFNEELQTTKKFANNLWTNWFYNKKVADNIEYIEY